MSQAPCPDAIGERLMNKRRRIATRRDHQPDRMIGTFILINLDQPFAKGVYGYPHDGVGLRVKVRLAPQGFHRDRIFLDLIRPALEVLFADVLQHSRQIARPAEDPGVQQPFIFLPLSLCSRGQPVRRSRMFQVLSRRDSTLIGIEPSITVLQLGSRASGNRLRESGMPDLP